MGGVEITCIYGVKGNEQRNLLYRSPAWVAAVQHVIREADRLDMGVDLPAGSGWRMGGPMVRQKDADLRVKVIKRDAADGAVEYLLETPWAGDKVKRPSPGGEGLSINPFSKPAVARFLEDFGTTLDQLPGLRAQFHDSFEYEGDWADELPELFFARHGYRLENELAALASDVDQERVARVKADYRDTLSELVLKSLVEPWVAWSHAHGQLARNQSHGSPANWLDLYASCDIPETESFGRLAGGDTDPLVMKFASSAANIAGRHLVSSETGTWLNEHFYVTLSELKEVIDRQMLAGVNHVIYHGTAYSPEDAPWPGWLFYAATQLNPQNPIWRDLPELNGIVTRSQSVLQASLPDNDVLLYWPIHDLWHDPHGIRLNITLHTAKTWFHGQPFGQLAKRLVRDGYAVDYCSDRLLGQCEVAENGRIVAPGGTYRAIVIPRTTHMPLATLERLLAWAAQGATVVIKDGLPSSEPGLAGLVPSDGWTQIIARATTQQNTGRLIVHEDASAALDAAGVRRESSLVSHGLAFLRKRWDGDTTYFLKNSSQDTFDGWAELSSVGQVAVGLDPVTGAIGVLPTTLTDAGSMRVRIQLAAGETLFVRVISTPGTTASPWRFKKAAGQAMTIPGPWEVVFLEGGPTKPAPARVDRLASWTTLPDPAASQFSGTVRYATRLAPPAGRTGPWLLSLGEVRHSARVRLDGREIATVVAPPYTLEIDQLPPAGALLEIDVTGTATNRIRYMDQTSVPWRIFEDINFVSIDYKKFDASKWRVRLQGLVGPVTLTPLEQQ
jgi:hypothetical protein